MDYAGIDGFLGTRASLMLDVVFLAMFAVIPVLAWSIYQVRYRRRFELHKRVQITLGIVLAVAVAAFEVDMQFLSGWEDRAAGERAEVPSSVWTALYIHLVFAVTTAILWIYVMSHALGKIPRPPRPSEHSRHHKFWGWIAAVDMLLTAITGWIFYILAFV